ncbi:hypothetical protein ABGB12_09225 [Actinocorallia sp. B10E7]|uniref:hypothetical protein n=1 Tax=Actinocorallia sp. B10E7 TaxID=3153558 RepID=UPI00325D6451
MIILSGLLVIVAIALLVAGIVTEEQGVLGLTGLQLIYVSIAVSVVSALCLAIGVLIRRRELFGSAPARPAAPKSRPTGRAARRAAAKATEEPAPLPEPEEDTPYAFPMPTAQVPDDALVYVIPGRKRYHLDTCRQLAGRQTEELTYIEAQEEGFSPCTACLPDTALAARATAAAAGGGAPDGEPDPGLATEPGPGLEPTLNFEAAPASEPDPAPSLPQERSGSFSAVGGMDWTSGPVSSEPPAADTITDWDPKALTADPLDPSYPLPEESYSGPNPLEPRRSGDSWSSPAPAEPFWSKSAEAEPALDRPTPEQGTPLPEPPLEESPLSGSPLEDPVLPEPVGSASDPEPEGDSSEDPASRPEHAAEEEALAEPAADTHPVVPGSREPEEAPGGPIVRILSGTKRYHRPDCALIEDIGEEDEDLESISRDTAKERGCTPCLVCQPDKEHAV